MRKIMVIAIREYLAAVKSKAFIVTLVLMPVMMAGSLVAEKALKGNVDLTPKRLAVVDRTGQLFDALKAAVEKRNTTEVFEEDDEDVAAVDRMRTREKDGPPAADGERRQVFPYFVLEKVDPVEAGGDELLLTLSDRVRKGELFAFAEIEPGVLDPPESSKPPAIRYFSNTPTYRWMHRWLNMAVTVAAQEHRFERSGLDPRKVAWALTPTEVDHLGLFERDASGRTIVPAKKVDEVASFIVPAMMVFLLFMVIMVGASPLIQSVLEEKTQRIAEVILASVTPFQWMMGKLIGMVGVSFTIVTVYLIGGLIVADRFGVMDMIPLHLLAWFLVYQAVSVLMFGAMFVAVGAACSDHREAQSAIMPVMLVIVMPMMVWMNVLREPNTLFATLISLFPPATPMLMLIRQAVPPGIPLWQPVLGMVLVLLTTVLVIFAASRIFRVGILMQGKGAGFRDMFRWVIRG
ncbi:MAG: ABC transporter permease [Phycisphaerales bacterium]|nr:ABC transporter permease [Phycisphaerales bacterium]